MKPTKLMCGSALALAMAATGAQAQVQIDWWHALGGELGELLEGVAEAFNESQDEFVVRPSFRGTYTETMTGAVAAFRDTHGLGEAPVILATWDRRLHTAARTIGITTLPAGP